MLNKFTIIIALRYFRAKKNEKFVSIISGISFIGITIGVAALIVVMSVMNGFHIELTKNIIGLNGDISVMSKSKTIPDQQKIIAGIVKQEFVQKISPVVAGQALALGTKTNSGVLIKGVELVDLKNKGEILGNVFAGTFEDYEGTNSVAVGFELAHNLGVSVGSKIKLISPNVISTAFGTMPRSKDFTVVAIFSSGMYDYDAATMLMPIHAAQKFLSLGNEINLIEINVKDPEFAKIDAQLLQKELGSDVRVSSWMDNNQQFLKALAIERTAMFTILSLIIIVAAFNIVSSLFMIVKDKTKDIAILKTMGASVNQIMFIFIINGLLIGFIGTLLGILSGLFISYNVENIRLFLEQISGTKIFDAAIYFLYNLSSVVRISDVIIVGSLSLLLSLLATIYPSFKAAKLNPVEAMRYE
ncbi:MAG: lipoprotein-releasing ABC transporter permease subunit [Rickettsiaceae bacterium]